MSSLLLFFFNKIFWDNRLKDACVDHNNHNNNDSHHDEEQDGTTTRPTNRRRIRTITVDGTDCRFQPPNDGRPVRAWYSHKFKKSAVRYEVAIAIQSGDIVWLSGPYPAGSFADITIFRTGGLKEMLLAAGERAEADLGYRGEPETIELPLSGHIDTHVGKARARMRHETCNKRFKQWACINSRFRHSFEYHHDCMTAVVVLTQFAIENGEPLFDARFDEVVPHLA